MRREDILQTLRANAEELRRRYGVESAIVFGSRARDEARDGSDIDVAIRFAPGARGDVMAVCGVSGYLSHTLGLDADIVSLPVSDPDLSAVIEREGAFAF